MAKRYTPPPTAYYTPSTQPNPFPTTQLPGQFHPRATALQGPPPLLYHSGPAVLPIQPMAQRLYKVKFLTNQIKDFAGCRQGYYKKNDETVADPPYDICIVYQEIVLDYIKLENLSKLHQCSLSCKSWLYYDEEPTVCTKPNRGPTRCER